MWQRKLPLLGRGNFLCREAHSKYSSTMISVMNGYRSNASHTIGGSVPLIHKWIHGMLRFSYI